MCGVGRSNEGNLKRVCAVVKMCGGALVLTALDWQDMSLDEDIDLDGWEAGNTKKPKKKLGAQRMS